MRILRRIGFFRPVSQLAGMLEGFDQVRQSHRAYALSRLASSHVDLRHMDVEGKDFKLDDFLNVSQKSQARATIAERLKVTEDQVVMQCKDFVRKGGAPGSVHAVANYYASLP